MEMGRSKKGDGKYWVIISLILGILVLTISLYFIFKEYFDQNTIDYENCRQSIYLRSISPDFHNLADLKNAMPLKCKTEVVNIDTAKPDEVYAKISDTVAAGWYLFGEGKFDIVPRKWTGKNYCMVFARVHYTEKAKNDFNKYLGTNAEAVKNILNPPKGINAMTGIDGYIAPITKFIEFNINFFTYYSSAKMKNSQQTYNDYLPLLSNQTSSEYLWLKKDISPSSSDLLFVYLYPKSGKLKSSIIGNIVTGVGIGVVGIAALPFSVPVGIAVVAGMGLSIAADKNIFEFESVIKTPLDKSIIITTPDDINSIGCDEFLTIPA